MVRSMTSSDPSSTETSDSEVTDNSRFEDAVFACSPTAEETCLANCSRPDWYSPEAEPLTLALPQPHVAEASASTDHFSSCDLVLLSVVSFCTVVSNRSLASSSCESMID